MFDHAQSYRLGQRVAIEQPGVQILASIDESPEAPYDGQLVYVTDEVRLYIWDGSSWVGL